tara:strand:+ start:661 stop:828 length:168 start_codon:yes stop_codon:yes gene_type:complete
MHSFAEGILALFIWFFIFVIFKNIFLKKANEFYPFEMAILVSLFMLYGWLKFATF